MVRGTRPHCQAVVPPPLKACTARTSATWEGSIRHWDRVRQTRGVGSLPCSVVIPLGDYAYRFDGAQVVDAQTGNSLAQPYHCVQPQQQRIRKRGARE